MKLVRCIRPISFYKILWIIWIYYYLTETLYIPQKAYIDEIENEFVQNSDNDNVIGNI